MTVNRLIAYVAMALLLGGCTSGDSDVAVDKIEYEGVSIEVPVTIEIESAWNIDEEESHVRPLPEVMNTTGRRRQRPSARVG